MLSNGQLNLPEDNMNSITKLRRNALIWSCVYGHRKEVSNLMKNRFVLKMFYQCFECCQRPFALLHEDSGQWRKKGFIDSMLPPKIQMGFIVSLKLWFEMA